MYVSNFKLKMSCRGMLFFKFSLLVLFLQLMLNEPRVRDDKTVPMTMKMQLGKAKLEVMREYDEFSRYMMSMKGSAKQRKSSMYNVSTNTLSLILEAFVAKLEEAIEPPKPKEPKANPTPKKDKASEEDDENEDEEAPCSFNASGSVEVPRIFHWKRLEDSKGGSDSLKKTIDDGKAKASDEECTVLGKKTTYIPQYTMQKVNYELWFGDVRKIDSQSARDSFKGHAAIGDCPYGFNPQLDYDKKPWKLEDVSCCFLAFVK